MIAGVSAVLLFFVMFLIDWFGVGGGTIDTGLGEVNVGDLGGANAWQSFGFIDIILFVTIGAAIAVAVMAANASNANLPVAGSALVAGLGILSVILILFRIISPPFDADRELGVFIGLILAGGIAFGGWTAMQEEGTSFSEQADRMQNRGGGGSGSDRSTGTGGSSGSTGAGSSGGSTGTSGSAGSSGGESPPPPSQGS